MECHEQAASKCTARPELSNSRVLRETRLQPRQILPINSLEHTGQLVRRYLECIDAIILSPYAEMSVDSIALPHELVELFVGEGMTSHGLVELAELGFIELVLVSMATKRLYEAVRQSPEELVIAPVLEVEVLVPANL